ncbi:MAG: dUTP diphosphatase [Phascolarctobacterium sp.]|nr:MAG: dUTP diphosphatase [Phascolarctobacterium sp.]
MPTPKATICKIKLLRPNAAVPEKTTDGAACYDLVLPDDILIPPYQALKVGLGFAIEVPKGYHAKIFLRSSTGKDTRLRLANGTGIVDSDYRGEVCLLVDNTSGYFARAFAGERIAQMMIEKNVPVTFVPTDELSETERNDGGFGSTGK